MSWMYVLPELSELLAAEMLGCAELTVPSPAIVMFVPAVNAATTFAVSVTSALASIASNFVPSVCKSLPSTVPETVYFHA